VGGSGNQDLGRSREILSEFAIGQENGLREEDAEHHVEHTRSTRRIVAGAWRGETVIGLAGKRTL
jgi:hypothetical protein